jgi:hypothetical protein
MTCKPIPVLAFCFVAVVGAFLATNYAHVKSPWQYREVASWNEPVRPLYDASFKL